MSVRKSKNIMCVFRNVFSLFFVVSGVLLYLGCYFIYAEKTIVQDQDKQKKEIVSLAVQSDKDKQDEFIYDSHGKKDPFSPPVITSQEKVGTESLAGIRLEGIIWDEDNPIAVINGKVVTVSDEINGAKIVQIKQNEVIFEINGQRMPVKLQTKVE